MSVFNAFITGAADAAPPLTALLSARMAADAIENATSVLVAEARDAGRTWQEIGELLSMSRQAAQQRFTERAPDPRDALLAARASEVVNQIEAVKARVVFNHDEKISGLFVLLRRRAVTRHR